MKYLDYLDFAKGIGIILVVMAHTMFPLHAAIDVFHMPLFFFIAGMTLKMYNDLTKYVVKKTDRILVPYLFFSILWSVVNFFHPLLGDYNGPLWFLLTLYVTLIVCQVLLRVKQVYLIYAILLFCVVLTYCIIRLNKTFLPFNLDRVFRALLFVYMGYIFTHSNFYKMAFNSKKLFVFIEIAIFMLVYIAGLYFMIRNEMIIEGEGFMHGEPYGRSMFVIYITSLAAIMVVLCMSYIIGMFKPINWLGRNSLTILCVHFPFTQYWNTFIANTSLYEIGWGKVVCALVSYIVIISFCIPWIYILKKYAPKWSGYAPLLEIESKI